MTTLQITLICIVCYMVVAIITSFIAYNINLNDVVKTDFGQPVHYEKPSLFSICLTGLFWPLIILYLICKSLVAFVDNTADFLESKGM